VSRLMTHPVRRRALGWGYTTTSEC
jgi:hypothetical protein